MSSWETARLNMARCVGGCSCQYCLTFSILLLVVFFIVQLSLPLFLRFVFQRKDAPLYGRVLAFSQDVWVASLLWGFSSFSRSGAAVLGLLIHLYLLGDAFLYREMKLRVRLRYLAWFREAGEWWGSAREMKAGLFLVLVCTLVALHSAGFVWGSMEPFFFASLGSGFVALASLFWIPKSIRYALFHPFFLRKVEKKEGESWPKSEVGERCLNIPIRKGEKPHLIFLFLESFPAKYVGTGATPQFDRLAKEGLFFSQIYANGTLTYRALLSGVFGQPAGSTAVGLSPYVNASFQGIPALLKRQGYRTAFHHNGSLRFDKQEPFLTKHFDERADQRAMGKGAKGWGVPDEALMRYSAEWLQRQKEPSFLTMFTISNHHPWIVPEGYLPPAGDRFLQTLHYADHALGMFIDTLRREGLSEKSIVFILGDHGQPRGEHFGNVYNSRFVYEENVHVPLLILADGRGVKGETITEVGSQIDLLPTVADLLDVKWPSLGVSLLRSSAGKTVFFQNPYSEGFWGCREERWKWIQNRMTEEEELYDLTEDRIEKNNLILSHPEVAEKLRKKTASFFTNVDALYEGRLEAPGPHFCLDLSNALVTDEELEKQLKPEWIRVNLENCLLLTDRGIQALARCCPDLEELCLKGVPEITQRGFEEIAQRCPQLRELVVEVKGVSCLPFVNLTRLKLFEADRITDEEMIAFCAKNPHLNRLVIHGSAQMTDRTLSALKALPLEQLWLYGAPRMTQAALSEFSSLCSFKATS